MIKRRGFTIVEFLIVIAVIGILAAIATPNYLNWRATTVTREAAQQFARDIDKQRTEAKRENADKTVKVPTGGSTTYQLINGAASSTKLRTVSLPGGTKITPVGTTTSFTFKPPYGTTDAVPQSYEIQWLNDASIKRTVRIVGITGKVIIQ